MKGGFSLFLKTSACAWIVLSALVAYRGCTPYFAAYPQGPMLYGEDGSDASLLVVNDESGKYGYCDASGNVVIEPRYDGAKPFHEGLAAVCRNSLWGYIDKNGKTVIPLRYYDADSFRGGKAFVSPGRANTGSEVDDLLCILIDGNGKKLQSTNYKSVSFSDGIFAAYSRDSVYYLDADYKLFLEKQNGYLNRYSYSVFSEGLATVTEKDVKVSYMDTSGNTVLEPDYLAGALFSEGFAAVCNYDTRLYGSQKYWTYIDNAGNTITDSVFVNAARFSEGLACVKTTDGKWMAIDGNGEEAFVIHFLDKNGFATFFSEGLCSVGKWNGGGKQ